ncbi:MAG: hypothetical protein KIT55_00355 [Nitrosomonas sp.]|nr:hypothetical protein [Nitrosomonas sp.]
MFAPCPAAILKYSKEDFFVREGEMNGCKHDKARWLADYYETAKSA